jgi:opacity protein-like surface antigen
MTQEHDEHNALPWHKRMFRWGPRNVKWIVLAVAITFGLGFCAESEAQSFSAGLAITKFGNHASGGTYCFDNNFTYCLSVAHHGSEDRSDKYEKNRHVNQFTAFYRSQFRDSKKFRPYTGIGISYANATTRTQSTKANFQLRVGLLYVRERWFGDLYIAHDSNAGYRKPNSGRDRLHFEIGRRF